MVAKYYRIRHKWSWEPRGLVMVDTLPDGRTVFGWSLCDNKDRFSKVEARNFALARMDGQDIVAITEDQKSVSDAISLMPHSLHECAIRAYLMEFRKTHKSKIWIRK